MIKWFQKNRRWQGLLAYTVIILLWEIPFVVYVLKPLYNLGVRHAQERDFEEVSNAPMIKYDDDINIGFYRVVKPTITFRDTIISGEIVTFIGADTGYVSKAETLWVYPDTLKMLRLRIIGKK